MEEGAEEYLSSFLREREGGRRERERRKREMEDDNTAQGLAEISIAAGREVR
jgi:hypothetical protein